MKNPAYHHLVIFYVKKDHKKFLTLETLNLKSQLNLNEDAQSEVYKTSMCQSLNSIK
jgi:hypothetical protein